MADRPTKGRNAARPSGGPGHDNGLNEIGEGREDGVDLFIPQGKGRERNAVARKHRPDLMDSGCPLAFKVRVGKGSGSAEGDREEFVEAEERNLRFSEGYRWSIRSAGVDD